MIVVSANRLVCERQWTGVCTQHALWRQGFAFVASLDSKQLSTSGVSGEASVWA
jgi:hypothetical protein